jgi:hypothetical protein
VLELVSPIYSLLRYADSQKIGTVSGFIPLVIFCRDMLEVYMEGHKELKNILALLDSRVKSMCQNTLMLAGTELLSIYLSLSVIYSHFTAVIHSYMKSSCP